MSDENALALIGELEASLPVRLKQDTAWLDSFKKSFSGLKPEEQQQVANCFMPTQEAADNSFGDFIANTGRWTPSYIRICQKEPDPPIPGVKLGDLVLDGTQQVKTPVAVIPIGFWRTRTLWDREVAGNKPVCKSYNCLVGTKFGDCEKCQYNSSFNSSIEKSKKCQLQMNMSAVIPGMWDRVFYFGFYGANFMFGVKLHKRVISKSSPKYLFTHHVTTRKEKGQGFTYYVFDLDTQGTVNTPKELYPLLRAYQYKSGLFVEDQIKRGQSGEDVAIDKVAAGATQSSDAPASGKAPVDLSNVTAEDGEIS
jgi:hypothetical protein